MFASINSFTQVLSKISAVLIFVLLMLCITVVTLRYGFNIGSIALQEAMAYCHAGAFLLALAATLQSDEHVRVDILYQHFDARKKAWINAIGSIVFALPFCSFLLYFGAVFFLQAWEVKEASAEAGGLAFTYLFKGLIPLAMLCLILQMLNMLAANLVMVFRKRASV